MFVVANKFIRTITPFLQLLLLPEEGKKKKKNHSDQNFSDI